MSRLTILLGDDHAILRSGLRKILTERTGWEVVGEAGEGRAAVQMATELKPDVAILDIGMPLLSGIEATRQITRRLPDTHVIVLSMHSEETYIMQALGAGARGYLLKDSADTELVHAVEAAEAGRSYFSPAVSSVLRDDYVRRLAERGVTDRYDTLSEREREVFQLVAEGHSNKSVATLLGVSPATVETHRAHIFEKLDVHNTAELVRYALRRGVIS